MARPTVPALLLLLAAGTTLAAPADPRRDKIIADYAAAAKAADPGFTGFSIERGRAIYFGPHQGNPDTPACATCHTDDPRRTGQHAKTGRPIAPMAVSVKPDRFTDFAEVEKRFGRDCKAVLGRTCTPRDRGDVLMFLSNQ